MDVTDLFELQRPFGRYRCVGSPPQEQEIIEGNILLGQVLINRAAGKEIAHQPWKLGQAIHQFLGFRGVQKPPGLAQEDGQQVQYGQRSHEGLGARHSDLDAGPHVEGTVGDSGRLAAFGIADGDQSTALVFDHLHGGNRIGRLARLTNGHNQRAGADVWVAVPELRCALRLRWQAAVAFHQMAAHLGCMQAGAATDQYHPVQIGYLTRRKREIREVHPPCFKIYPLTHGAGHGLGLLHYLFQHEMLVTGLINQHFFLRDHPGLLVDVVPFKVLVLDPFPGDHHHLTGLKKAHLAHVGLGLEQRQQSRQIAPYDRLSFRLRHHNSAGVPQPQGADLGPIAL